MSVSEFPGSGNAPAGVALPVPTEDLAVWRWTLDRTEDAWPALWSMLSPAERERAGRFGTLALRRRYVAGRAALRETLASYLGIASCDVPIARGPRGRPVLVDNQAPDFNVSHTRDVVVIALLDRRAHRVGIDIEAEDRSLAHDSLARKYLSDDERAAIATLDEDARRRAFLRLWTCKEAMSKATGDGLSAPFANIGIDTSRGLAVVAGPQAYTPERWSLHAVDAGTGHFTTIAIWRAS